MTGKQWRWVGWMAFSAVLLVSFGVATYRNIREIRDAESTVATMIEDPIVAPTGEFEIATVRVRFETEDARSVETYVIGVPVDSERGDTVTVYYLGSKPEDAKVEDPPNRTLSLVLSTIFALIGAGGILAFGHDPPWGEDED